ncbi:MAG: hypothetical protein J6W82_02590 [Bacteroidales bacterium]|jgi:hypothetical protein|nr:hypothetical protein [Bacteroidales bacterium]
MVGSIDIKRLNMEELLGVVNIYPWYAGAHMELCSRLAASGGLGAGQLSQAALYVSSRRLLSDLMRRKADYSDSQAGELLRRMNEPAAPEAPEAPAEVAPAEAARRIFVVGGDYFSSTQYKEVRHADDNIFSGFATSERDDVPAEAPEEAFDFCTETLAEIYAEQGYLDEAKQIYSKLSLRYPEKSVYFAALIEKLDKN